MKRKYYLLYSSLFLTSPLFAAPQPIDQINKIENFMQVKISVKNIVEPQSNSVTANLLLPKQSNLQVTEQLLNQALQQRKFDLVEKLLAVYARFSNKDETLFLFAQGALAQGQQNYGKAIGIYRQLLTQQPQLNFVRIELAKTFFFDQQNRNARAEFDLARAVEEAPLAEQLIQDYLTALDERDGWQTSVSAYYLSEKNVNNTASAREIENTGFIKGDGMLPQRAHGLTYNLSVERDWNLFNGHYVHMESSVNGKFYWDNRDYDDVYNRNYLGYRHKSARQTISLLPFYERRWYGNERYNWVSGVRGELTRWLTPNWQFSGALEWGKSRYFSDDAQNGTNRLASATLLWLRNSRQYFYAGVDFNRERTWAKQYGSNLKGLRLGWGQALPYGISSRLSAGISKRDFKGKATLGGILPLGKVREDMIYTASLNLWKRDWQVFGLTPKLHFFWKKQDSNLNTLYSYSEHGVRLVIERDF